MTKEMRKIVEHILGNTFLVKNPLEGCLFFYPVRLFRSAHLLDFEKKSSLFVYSDMYVY